MPGERGDVGGNWRRRHKHKQERSEPRLRRGCYRLNRVVQRVNGSVTVAGERMPPDVKRMG